MLQVIFAVHFVLGFKYEVQIDFLKYCQVKLFSIEKDGATRTTCKKEVSNRIESI
jgi:hypothetical protein